jgi:aspartyl-tRNA(Asn)/glutamyl-tRNA(Gln) amidotransferase subunit B
LLEHGGDPAEIARRRGLEALDTGSLSVVVAETIAAHPEVWQRFVDGEEKLMGFFTGHVMRATAGQADGKAVAAELIRLRG